MRFLYQSLGEGCNVSTPVPERPGERGNTTGMDERTRPERWCARDPRWCPLRAASPLLALRFTWQPFLSAHAVRTVTDTAVTCEREPARCPHLVFLDAGLWYSYAIRPDLGGPESQRALLFRQQLEDAADAIRRLARCTRVVWRLDERVLFDLFEKDRQGIPLLLALHALVYELKSQVPSLTVWSSGLPVSTVFARRLCFPIRDAPWPWSPEHAQRFHAECGDAIHGSAKMRRRYLDTVLADLCTDDQVAAPDDRPLAKMALGDDGGAAPSSRPSAPMCCGAFRSDDAELT
ncbi:uncharacterized protein LOC119112915 [Pollicipes pollicipes]|uniref:uncharacterized protein LOC119112915 n=1 Tax=Pollicipes pollicipes TaxID=41117 RepID=UPI001884CF8A|nr:uncharacterized protein LOC119112915 [Pollicipes pollicipes]